MQIADKKILIGITGSIAAYKICELIRMFKSSNNEVRVMMTLAAQEFVGTITLETLSCNPLYTNQFAPRTNTEHIALAEWADILILAPLSANTLSKVATGICDNLLSSVFCAYFGKKKPVILAPAMNEGMWENPFVQKNLNKLKDNGCIILEPDSGFLACGTEGKGRLCPVEKIYNKTAEILSDFRPLKGKKILITAGGTKEAIDPVRYITNASSGKMGVCIADAAYAQGAEVELIATFDIQRDYKVTRVSSAEQMLIAVQNSFCKCDYLIMAAAVSDYKVKNYSEQKISKEKNDCLTLELIKNPDILETVSASKKESQKVIGFCLATHNILETAKNKIKTKRCDYIIANEAQIALNTDYNEVWIVDKKLDVKKIPQNTKQNIAHAILELLYD